MYGSETNETREEGDERNDLYEAGNAHGLVQPPKVLLLEHDSNPCALLP